jgi:hypothetical protein
MNAKSNCLTKHKHQWNFDDYDIDFGLVGLTTLINTNVDKDAKKVCVLMSTKKFTKKVLTFNKCNYLEHGEICYTNNKSQLLIPLAWSLEELLPDDSSYHPEQIHIKIIKL